MRRFAKEKVKHWLRVLLHTQDSAERTSLAFALGVFIAFLPPVPWFHTLFALLIAFVFRLNRVAVLIGSYVNTPLTMAPLVIVEVSVGHMFLGGDEAPDVAWRQLNTWQGWKDAAVELRPFVPPLLLGGLLLGLLASTVAYVISFTLISRYRSRLAFAAVHPAPGEIELQPAPGRTGAEIAPPHQGSRGGGRTVGGSSPGAPVVDTPENHS